MRFKIGETELVYDDYGQGPVVLFIHDEQSDRQIWTQQIEPVVAAGFRVILADLRPVEQCSRNNESSIRRQSSDLVSLLDYLGIGRAAVCGLAFGGSVLHDLLENFPQRIAGAYLATGQTMQPPQSETLVAALQSNGQSKNTRPNESAIPTMLIGDDYHPVTHLKQAAPATPPAQTKKQGRQRLVAMENMQEFNRQLLDFLINLAPRKNDPELTPLSSTV